MPPILRLPRLLQDESCDVDWSGKGYGKSRNGAPERRPRPLQGTPQNGHLRPKRLRGSGLCFLSQKEATEERDTNSGMAIAL